ncbi:hypothetical protein I203_108130 [Kwoniella mangroviensis CBS 8507]|uniref:hypothetical protein n=1 Tax=Kwoniella mangroviensis CBS 8507 TaxID=1296122 RepID=UPI00080D1B22|nr:uncharacterized protein I203_05023 [Kwoniella mangroviensis CBS 8507]OCF66001.1 hypothetical protein I203_05023 [Kwoniella mangroviensis CBS 8507]
MTSHPSPIPTKSEETQSTENAPSSSPLRTARSLVLLQLLSRLLTFTLNQVLLRLASPAVFGTAAIQLDLTCSTILFLSREGIRNALLRTKLNPPGDDVQKDERQVKALSTIPFQLGLVISVIVGSIYIYSSDSTTTSQPNFYPSLGMYILGSLMELSIEPVYIAIHRSKTPRLGVRLRAEGGMAILRSVITVISLLGLGDKNALLSFALGQMAGAGWLLVVYLKEVKWDVNTLFRADRVKGETRFNSQTVSLALANTGQSFIKHLLTEADRIAVARICPLDGQGGYAVAMNYGSLIARIIFQPLEESLLLHYSSSSPTSPHTISLYTLTIRLSLYLATIILSFVQPLYPSLSVILLPKQYQSTSAPSILHLYLISYIPLMSLNGITETFVTSSATPKQIKEQSKWMIASSLVFALTLFGLTNTDFDTHFWNTRPTREESLILASCSAMLVRIVFSFLHAKSTFSTKFRVKDVLPDLRIIIWNFSVWFLLDKLAKTGRWKVNWKGWIELIGAGGVLGLVTLGFIFLVERGRLHDLRSSSKGKKVE